MLGLAVLVSVLGLAREASCKAPVVAAGTPAAAKQYIVEFGHGVAPRDLAADASVKLVKTYKSPLFTGAVVEVESEGSAAKMAAGNQVVNMWPNHAVALDQPLDVKSFLDDVSAVDYSVHKATGVDRLHAAGILGKGVKVAIVDSGVWYKHPALGGGFGAGFKVAGGWDFAGDSSDPDAPRKPDADPLDTPAIGHGTHVAGIVAAVSDGFVGVAPNATLLAYKVMSAVPGTDSATIIDAWLRAFDDGADVITTSIGTPVGWRDNALAAVASRIVRQGVVMTMSAGNNGAEGAFFGGEGGSSEDALAVASVQADVSPATRYNLTVTLGGVSNTTTGGYMSDVPFPTDVKNWPVVALSMDPETAADACQPYPAGTQNLTGKVALVRRGGCNYSIKQRNLEALGCKNMLVYNDGRIPVNPGSTLPTSTMAMITAPAGHAIIKALAAGADVTVDFSRGGLVGLPDTLGGTPSTFSSWAATYDLLLKPDVAAPGGDIFSTWPENQFQVQSGTSMATPYIAGIAALYISALGGRHKHGPNFAIEFNQRVIAAGKSLPWNDGQTTSNLFLAPALQMGSGLVNASRVLYAGTTVDKAKLSLNDTRNFQGVHEVTVTNGGASAVAYNFTLEPAAGFEILDPFMSRWNTWGVKPFEQLSPMDLVPDAQLPEPFSLAPGESKKVTIAFANPANDKGWNATVIPTYSGKVLVHGDNGDVLSLPYLGVASDLYETKRVFRNTYPIVFGGEPWTEISKKSSYTFNLTTGVRDFPFMFTSFDWGVSELRWDIFEAGWAEEQWRYPPREAKGFVGAVAVYSGKFDPDFQPPTNLSDPAVNSQTTPMPARHLSRRGMSQPGDDKRRWLGRLANGTQIAPGNYTMRVAAARPFADLSKVDGWEVWRHEIQVLPMQ